MKWKSSIKTWEEKVKNTRKSREIMEQCRKNGGKLIDNYNFQAVEEFILGLS